MEDLAQIIEIDPENVDAHIHHRRICGQTSHLTENKEEAASLVEMEIEAYTVVIELDVEQTDAYLYRGKACLHFTMAEEAWADNQIVLSLYPDNAEAHLGKGFALWMLDENDNAQASVKQALSLGFPDKQIPIAETVPEEIRRLPPVLPGTRSSLGLLHESYFLNRSLLAWFVSYICPPWLPQRPRPQIPAP